MLGGRLGCRDVGVLDPVGVGAYACQQRIEEQLVRHQLINQPLVVDYVKAVLH